MFEDILPKISDATAIFAVPMNELQQMRSEFPSIPEPYIRFLEEIGCGDIGGMQIYSGLISPSEIFPSVSKELKGVAIFGDDFQAYHYGFDTHNHYQLVEVDPQGEVRPLDEPFETCIRRRVC